MELLCMDISTSASKTEDHLITSAENAEKPAQPVTYQTLEGLSVSKQIVETTAEKVLVTSLALPHSVSNVKTALKTTMAYALMLVQMMLHSSLQETMCECLLDMETIRKLISLVNAYLAEIALPTYTKFQTTVFE
jgi:hypothetical protein